MKTKTYNRAPKESLLKAKKSLRWSFDSHQTKLLQYQNVHTVCEESRCPNRHECSSANIATFLIGGRVCTRSCNFCHIATGKPQPLAPLRQKELGDILAYVDSQNIQYVVITAVARDDDERSLAEHFAEITRELNKRKVQVELLIPDFHARAEFLDIVASSNPLVIAQNMETVESLTKAVRPQAGYATTLKVFDYLRERFPQIVLKSGFMLGLGETLEEVFKLLQDLRQHHVEVVTVGQYFQPSEKQRQVEFVYSEDMFALVEEEIKKLDFFGYEIGPFIRSSYMASRVMKEVLRRKSLQ